MSTSLAIPLPSKTWKVTANVAIPDQGSANAQGAQVALTLIATLTGIATYPWRVRGSSNSIAAGMDSVNRLAAQSNIVAANGGAHSWIVLAAPNGAQWCIDWGNSVNKYQATRVFSPYAGFTGGSTVARPTATDEIVSGAVGSAFTPGTNARYQLHVVQSSTGDQTMMALMCQGYLGSMMFMGSAASPVSGWTTPVYGYFSGNSALNNGLHVFSNVANAGYVVGKGPGGALTFSLYSRGGGLLSDGNFPSLASWADNREQTSDARYFICPLGLLGTTGGMQGRHGLITDLWRTGQNMPSGTVFRYGNSVTLACFGGWVFPWDSTITPKVL